MSSEEEWVPVCSLVDLRDRLHAKVKDRYVTLISHDSEIYCIDSVCFHMGGPLGGGDIEEINGSSCLVCPWHKLKISLADGKKLSNVIIAHFFYDIHLENPFL